MNVSAEQACTGALFGFLTAREAFGPPERKAASVELEMFAAYMVAMLTWTEILRRRNG